MLHHKIKKHAKRIALDTIGWLCILLGVVGLVLPILQGLLFLAIGFYILSVHSQFARKIVDKVKHFHPKITPHFEWIERRAERFLKYFVQRD